MNKKNKMFSIFSLVIVLALGIMNKACAEYDYRHPIPEERGFRPPHHAGMKELSPPPQREDFEKRLNLTQEQKNIAKAQREKSIEKIKPLIEQINLKKDELIKLQEAQSPDVVLINKLETEIRQLRKQTHEIRRENMKAFEASLSDEQRKEMMKMKEEGRKRFEEMHKNETSKKPVF